MTFVDASLMVLKSITQNDAGAHGSEILRDEEGAVKLSSDFLLSTFPSFWFELFHLLRNSLRGSMEKEKPTEHPGTWLFLTKDPWADELHHLLLHTIYSQFSCSGEKRFQYWHLQMRAFVC